MRTQNILLVLVFFALIFTTYFQCNTIKNFEKINEHSRQNITALLDTVTKRSNKNNELFYEIATLQTNLKDLQLLNSNLYNEVVKMKGQVKNIANYDLVSISKDTIYSKENFIYTYIDSTKKVVDVPFHFIEELDSNFLELKGKTVVLNDTVSKTFLDYRKIKINVTSGFYEENGVTKVFVKSNSPMFEIQNISAAILEPKKTKKQLLFIGPSISYGVDLNGNFKPFLGVSVGLNLLQLKK